MQDEGKIFTEQRAPRRDFDRFRSTRSPKQQSNNSSRWLLKLSLGVLLISTIAWGWIKLANPETFPIYNVEIRGHYARVDHNNLRQAIIPFIQRGFLMMDVTGLQDRLQQLSWVATAKIKRVWPDKVIITLTEQKPFARVSKTALLNTEGDLFTVKPATIPTGLPLFIGPPDQQKLMLQTYKSFSAALAPLNLKIATLAVDNQQFWRLQLDNGIVLLIGKTDYSQRLQRLVDVYSQVVGNKVALIDYIDLRYNHGVAVHFKSQNNSVIKA